MSFGQGRVGADTPARPVYFLPFLNSLRAVSTSAFDHNRILILPTLKTGGARIRPCRMARCRFGWWMPSILATSFVEYFRMVIYTYINSRKHVKRKVKYRVK